jgi:predicted ATPase
MISRLIHGKALPTEIADQIVDRTDGVPLFIEELTKAVVESGELADAGDHYAVTRPLSALKASTPKPAISSRLSTAGSPKAWTRQT